MIHNLVVSEQVIIQTWVTLSDKFIKFEQEQWFHISPAKQTVMHTIHGAHT